MTDPDELSILRKEPFSKVVEQFDDLVNSCDALTFLMGAGCSKCAGLPLTNELTDMVLSDDKLDCTSKKILNEVKNIYTDANNAHIENYLSEIVDLLAITDRRAELGVTQNTLFLGDAQYDATALRNASNQIKQAIASAIDKKVNIAIHQKFVTAVHRPVRVGRPASSLPVDYLVLNYDTIIEDSLALEKFQYADGLYGGPTAWWKPDTFDGNELRARVIKIHGSINWRQFQNESTPRRIAENVESLEATDLPVLIWPSSTKYQETQLDPFAQLLDRARQSIRPPTSGQRLVVICGYSFGDSHINLEIDKALQESNGNLTIAAFTDTNEPTGQLKKWNDDINVREHVLIFANRGFFHGVNEMPSSDLPWWKFENLTRILGGTV